MRLYPLAAFLSRFQTLAAFLPYFLYFERILKVISIQNMETT